MTNYREIGSEFDLIPLSDFYFEHISSQFRESVFLRSGRETLGLIAETYKDTRKVILLPSYICQSMVRPFEERGWRVVFYELSERLFVEAKDVIPIVKKHNPDLFLIMSYFQAYNYESLLSRIKIVSPLTKVIFDFTHCLLDFELIRNQYIDYYVASLRKWFGVAGGAVLLSDAEINRDIIILKDDSIYLKMKEKALSVKYCYLSSGDCDMKESFKQDISVADQNLVYDEIHYISDEDKKRILSLNTMQIKQRRSNNLNHLWQRIKSIHSIKCLIDPERKSFNANFMLPILIDNRPAIQKNLADQGIYTQVVWRVPDDAPCENSRNIYKHILCIPIDQRYNYWDMEYAASIITKTMEIEKQYNYE